MGPDRSGTWHHYVIVRNDLPIGVKLAQTIHATNESCEGPMPSGSYAYALSVPDEETLRNVHDRLWLAMVPCKLIVETDGQFAGQAMTIGIFPTRDKQNVGRYVSDLPLAR